MVVPARRMATLSPASVLWASLASCASAPIPARATHAGPTVSVFPQTSHPTSPAHAARAIVAAPVTNSHLVPPSLATTADAVQSRMWLLSSPARALPATQVRRATSATHAACLGHAATEARASRLHRSLSLAASAAMASQGARVQSACHVTPGPARTEVPVRALQSPLSTGEKRECLDGCRHGVCWEDYARDYTIYLSCSSL